MSKSMAQLGAARMFTSYVAQHRSNSAGPLQATSLAGVKTCQKMPDLRYHGYHPDFLALTLRAAIREGVILEAALSGTVLV